VVLILKTLHSKSYGGDYDLTCAVGNALYLALRGAFPDEEFKPSPDMNGREFHLTVEASADTMGDRLVGFCEGYLACNDECRNAPAEEG
jgi:hypothetical protein